MAFGYSQCKPQRMEGHKTFQVQFRAAIPQRPDVVESPDGSYDMVIIGSGNREKPVDTSVQNYMLFYRDYDQNSASSVTTPCNWVTWHRQIPLRGNTGV